MPDTVGIMNELAAFLRRPDIAAEMEDDLRTLVAVPSVGAPGGGGLSLRFGLRGRAGRGARAGGEIWLCHGESRVLLRQHPVRGRGKGARHRHPPRRGTRLKGGLDGRPLHAAARRRPAHRPRHRGRQGAVHRLALHAAFPEGDAPHAALRRAADSGLRRGERLHRPCALPLGAQRALLRLHARFGVPGLHR